jgi:hypothetical protein
VTGQKFEGLKYRLRKTFLGLTWIAVSYIVLRPVLEAPLLADDFLAPFTEFRLTRGSLSESLDVARSIIADGVSFRPLATFITAINNFLTIELGMRFSVSPLTTFKYQRLLAYLFLIDALARLTSLFLVRKDSTSKPFDLSIIRILISVLLLGSLQIHLLWSNDPVTNYLLSGLVPVALSIHFIRFGILAIESAKNRYLLWTFLTGLSAALLYELTIGYALGIFTYAVLQMIRNRNRRLNSFRVAIASLFPVIVVVGGRIAYRSAAQSYGGTTIGTRSEVFETFLSHLISNMPTSAWDLSSRVVPDVMSFRLTAAITSLAGTVYLWVVLRRSATNTRIQRPVLTLTASAMILAAGLLSTTSKVQIETTQIGQVYIPFAYGIPFIAGACLLILQRFAKTGWIRPLAFASMAFLIFIQLNLNYNISDYANRVFAPNAQVLKNWSEKSPIEERCQALAQWQQMSWPDYYRTEMTEGLNSTYTHFQGEPFC